MEKLKFKYRNKYKQKKHAKSYPGTYIKITTTPQKPTKQTSKQTTFKYSHINTEKETIKNRSILVSVSDNVIIDTFWSVMVWMRMAPKAHIFS